MDNAEALSKALTTSDLSTGLLSDEQARAFVRQVFAATPMLQAARTVVMHARKQNIDLIGIGQRLLRKRTEGAAFATAGKPTTSQVQLSAVDLQLPWEVTEETFRYNLEGEGFEDTLVEMMSRQVAIDLCDLAWNGDTTDPSATTLNGGITAANPADGGALTVASTAGYPPAGTLVVGTGATTERIQYDGLTSTTFKSVTRGADGTTKQSFASGTAVDLATDGLLTATDGWLKKASVAARTVDGSAINSGGISKEHFQEALAAMPNPYLSAPSAARFRWIMHPRQRINWLNYLAGRATAAGDAALLGPQGVGLPYGWPILEDPTLPVGTLVFTDPLNLVLGIALDISIKRDAASRDVISRGVRYYQIDLAADVQIERNDAVVKVTGLTA